MQVLSVKKASWYRYYCEKYRILLDFSFKNINFPLQTKPVSAYRYFLRTAYPPGIHFILFPSPSRQFFSNVVANIFPVRVLGRHSQPVFFFPIAYLENVLPVC
jgi:hypothetical protein